MKIDYKNISDLSVLAFGGFENFRTCKIEFSPLEIFFTFFAIFRKFYTPRLSLV